LRPPRNSAEFAILDEDIQRYTTAQYRAPEMVDIYKGFPIDEKSDIWALGVFLYKLCYYTTPFEREGQLAILNARYTFPMKPVYSDRLKRIIIATLQPDPRNRPNVYQVLKEVCLMRSVEVPIKDIYAHPVENEEEVTSVAAEDRMAKVTPHSRAEPPSALVRTQPAMPQERTVPEVTPMYRGRPPKVEPDASSADATNTGATLIPPPVSRTRSLSRSPSKSPVFSDPFIMLDTGKNTPGGGGEPQRPAPLEFDLDSYDFESRYPTIEELTKDLTKQPFTFSQPSTKAVTCHDDPGFDQSTDKVSYIGIVNLRLTLLT
jgi:AP2-associated kinase